MKLDLKKCYLSPIIKISFHLIALISDFPHVVPIKSYSKLGSNHTQGRYIVLKSVIPWQMLTTNKQIIKYASKAFQG